MAAVRGRQITTFGGLFTSIGLDGASPPAIILPGARRRHRLKRESDEHKPVRLTKAVKRETHKVED